MSRSINDSANCDSCRDRLVNLTYFQKICIELFIELKYKEDNKMETIIVGERGQVTIPKSIRKKYNIKAKQPLIIEDRNGEIVIKPVIVIPTKDLEKYAREFSDEFIEEVIRENKLTPAQEKEIVKKLKKNA